MIHQSCCFESVGEAEHHDWSALGHNHSPHSWEAKEREEEETRSHGPLHGNSPNNLRISL
jgi:hypothetical protein